MKTVKAKLFTGFVVVIAIILILLSFVSIKLYSYTQETEMYDQLDDLLSDIMFFVQSNDNKKINEINKYIDLKTEFLIILNNDKLLFSNKNNVKTEKILEELKEDFKVSFEENTQPFEEEVLLAPALVNNKYLITMDSIKKGTSTYDIYLGVEEKEYIRISNNIYYGIIIINLVLFILLVTLGYVLISKTIKPLKIILSELKELQKGDNLSKRLKKFNTNDEFEELTSSLNKMLNNIENSVESIKQFTSDASHELRTPITVIQGEIELAKDADISKEELKKTLFKINSEQKKLQGIIRDFLLLSRLDKEVIKNEKTSLDKVVFEAIEQYLGKLELKKLELKIDVEDELDVLFNEKYLFIIINNLISNAVKYTNEGSILISAKKTTNGVLFKIKDTGIGIPKEEQEKVFERFYRVDKVRSNQKNGIGLGLAIVKKICEVYGAKIILESELQKGSSFEVHFKC